MEWKDIKDLELVVNFTSDVKLHFTYDKNHANGFRTRIYEGDVVLKDTRSKMDAVSQMLVSLSLLIDQRKENKQ